MERHSGEIFVESLVGSGTTFHLFLPAATDTQEAQPLRERQSETPPPSDVLVVEDDVLVAEGLSNVLKDADMSVDIAPTGTAACVSVVDCENPLCSSVSQWPFSWQRMELLSVN